MKSVITFASILAGLIINAGCTNGPPTYESLVRAGLGSEVKNDSLFLGYRFGMTRDEFYRMSWDLNQQEVISGLVRIEYRTDFLPHPATMHFYPEFYNDRIYKMPVEIAYDAWSPWNDRFSPDSLLVDAVQVYQEKYGTAFHKVHVPYLDHEAYLMVDGGKSIAIYRKSETSIQVEFTDLIAKRAKEDAQSWR